MFVHFSDITNLELTVKLTVVANFNQVVTDSEKKLMKKKIKYIVNKKDWLSKFYALVRFLSSYCPKSSLFFLPHFMPTPIFAIISILIFTLISHLGFLAILLSCYLLTFIS